MTLDQIPLDAPFRGDGPLYVWDTASQAWVSFPQFPAPFQPSGAGDRSSG